MTGGRLPFDRAPTPVCAAIDAARETELRAAVVAEARKWEGARYIQQAGVRYEAVDCAMLLVRCWVDAGIFQPFDPRPYEPNWHLNKGAEERYLGWIESLAVEVDTPRPGDIVLWRFGHCYSHGGIIMNARLHVMHALAGHGRCSVTDLDEAFLRWNGAKQRARKFFDPFAPLRVAA